MLPAIFPAAEECAAATFAKFAQTVHARVPDNYSIDIHTDRDRGRAICGDHGRVVPTSQGVCPICAGYVEDAAFVARLRSLAQRLRVAS